MSISNLYMLSAANVAAGQINQVKNYDLDPGIEEIVECADGNVDYEFAAVLLQSPKLGFSSEAIKRALDIAGIGGYSIAAAADFYLQKIAQGGTRTGGASSVKISGSKGLLVPTRITCQDKQLAQIQMMAAMVSSDGTTAPIAVTTGQSMPSTTTYDQAFVNGPISVNGTTIEGIKNLVIDFGIEPIIEHGSGEAYPTFVGILKRQPRISFSTTDAAFANTIGMFANQSASDSMVYLRKVAAGGTRVANGTSEHIGIAIDAGMIFTRKLPSGDERGIQLTEVDIVPTWDGTNDVLAIDTTSAIS